LQVFRSVDAVSKALAARPDTGKKEPEVLAPPEAGPRFAGRGALSEQLQLIAQMIGKGVGARIYYASIDGFDTHARPGARKRASTDDRGLLPSPT
jgi:uncharacterized protein (DUF1501 family)